MTGLAFCGSACQCSSMQVSSQGCALSYLLSLSFAISSFVHSLPLDGSKDCACPLLILYFLATFNQSTPTCLALPLVSCEFILFSSPDCSTLLKGWPGIDAQGYETSFRVRIVPPSPASTETGADTATTFTAAHLTAKLEAFNHAHGEVRDIACIHFQ